MEVAPAESSESNTVETSLPEIEPKEAAVEVGVPVVSSESEVVLSDKGTTSDKELSWEKIAAEIAAEEIDEPIKENETQITHEESVPPSEIKDELKEEQTVIDTVTEENIVTESVSEAIPDSTQEQSEELTETEKETVLQEADSITEPPQNAEPISEEVTVEEVDEVTEVEEVDEVTEVEEVDEVTEAPVEVIPVDDIIEIQEPDQSSAPEPETKSPEKSKVSEEIEISELKPEEVPEAAEVVEDLEYQVLEAEEVETNEIIEKHLAQATQTRVPVTETVVIINPDKSETKITIQQVDDPERSEDESQTYAEEIYVVTKDNDNEVDNPKQSDTKITIEQQVDDPERSEDESQTYTEEIYLVTKDTDSEETVIEGPKKAEVSPTKPKKQRGRKPIADIPLHVLGRDISKPTEGVSNGGRTMPKPRLGVKVPYRNLTSQIVSKQEIEKEIMERFKLKQEQNAANSTDVLFARKLTQRLAKKLIPTEKDKDKSVSKLQEMGEEPSSSVQNEKSTSEIKNNSDLIAILEGEGDDIELTKQKEIKAVEIREIVKKTEKEIALQQLKELPGKTIKVVKTKNEEEKRAPSPQKESKVIPVANPHKPNIEKKHLEVEPRLKTGMVIKTYTRKRKSTELEPILPLKKTVVAATIKSEDGSPTNVYITKSSRVIKRKVIWDPDEVPSKSPLKSPKVELSVKSPPTKPLEKKEPVKSVSTKPVEKKEPVKSVSTKPLEKKEPVKSSPTKPLEKKEPIVKKEDKEKKVLSPVKKIIVKTPPLKKRLTEVDKLLMDEGAVNMLYDVKTNEETTPDKVKKKTNKSVISLDRAHKELMSKTNVIKNDLQQNTSKDVQKSLRKKEIVSPTSKKEMKKEATPSPVTRKKSKDSVRSSVHSPNSSPPYNAAEASRIIRRHSSSSFSSNDEMDEEGEEKTTKKKGSVSESPKKKMKKSGESKPVKDVKDVKDAKNNNNTVTEGKTNHVDKTVGQYKSFTVTKKNKLVAIKLQTVEGKCYLNEQVLKDLTSCLKEFGKDDECHLVSITSDSNESFCEGLDYRLLTAEDEGGRKKKANELATLVKEFLRCLLNFPKVLVAGIQGDCVGLGVTMLPLFDMVIASDTSTFSAPYARLGCVPEAGFLLTVPHLSSHGLASELLYASQTVKADDAFRRGLVTRLCWPEKYQQELKTMLSQVASQSRQSIEATKQQLRQHILQSTEAALSALSKVLVENWTSPECQKNFSK